MKYLAPLVAVVITLFAWWALSDTAEAPTKTGNTYTSAEQGISFSYPNGYALSERDESGAHMITLIADSAVAPEAGEGPTSITVQVVPNPKKQTTEEWIRSSPLSNFRLSGGTPAEVLVGTESALAFAWDGLYPGTTIVQARGEKIYAFSVTYLSPEDPIRTHFAQVVASATFQ